MIIISTSYKRFPRLGIRGTRRSGRNRGRESSGLVGGCIAGGVNGYVGRTFQLGAKGDTCFIHVRREAQSNWEKSEGVRRRDRSSQILHLRPLELLIHRLTSFMTDSASQIFNHHLGSSISEHLCQIHHFRAPISDHPSRINYPSEINHPSLTIRFRSITRLFRSSVSDQSWVSDQ